MINVKLQSDAFAFLDQVEQQAKDDAAADFESQIDAVRQEASQAQSEIQDLRSQLESAQATIADQAARLAAQAESSGQPVPADTFVGTMNYADGTAYTNMVKKNVASFSYSRKFKSTKWGTIILPVALDYADWKDRFEIAEISGVQVNSDGTYTAERVVLGAGSSTLPNHPYLIRSKAYVPSKEQSITKKNCTVWPAKPQTVEIPFGDKTFFFFGSYERMTAADLVGSYYASGGKFVPATGSLNPMRVFLEIF